MLCSFALLLTLLISHLIWLVISSRLSLLCLLQLMASMWLILMLICYARYLSQKKEEDTPSQWFMGFADILLTMIHWLHFVWAIELSLVRATIQPDLFRLLKVHLNLCGVTVLLFYMITNFQLNIFILLTLDECSISNVYYLLRWSLLLEAVFWDKTFASFSLKIQWHTCDL